jgi:hypothetical protein
MHPFYQQAAVPWTTGSELVRLFVRLPVLAVAMVRVVERYTGVGGPSSLPLARCLVFGTRGKSYAALANSHWRRRRTSN